MLKSTYNYHFTITQCCVVCIASANVAIMSVTVSLSIPRSGLVLRQNVIDILLPPGNSVVHRTKLRS